MIGEQPVTRILSPDCESALVGIYSSTAPHI